MVLALPLAAVEPNTTTGPCTATCSRGAKYNNWSLHCHLQPWSQILPLVLALPLAAVEPGTKQVLARNQTKHQVLALLTQPWSLA